MESFPVLCRSAAGLNTKQIAKYILHATEKKYMYCSAQWCVKERLLLVIRRAVGHVTNVLSDGLGAWIHNRNKHTYCSKGGSEVTLIRKDEYGSPSTFCVKRASYVNKHELPRCSQNFCHDGRLCRKSASCRFHTVLFSTWWKATPRKSTWQSETGWSSICWDSTKYETFNKGRPRKEPETKRTLF